MKYDMVQMLVDTQTTYTNIVNYLVYYKQIFTNMGQTNLHLQQNGMCWISLFVQTLFSQYCIEEQ